MDVRYHLNLVLEAVKSIVSGGKETVLAFCQKRMEQHHFLREVISFDDSKETITDHFTHLYLCATVSVYALVIAPTSIFDGYALSYHYKAFCAKLLYWPTLMDVVLSSGYRLSSNVFTPEDRRILISQIKRQFLNILCGEIRDRIDNGRTVYDIRHGFVTNRVGLFHMLNRRGCPVELAQMHRPVYLSCLRKLCPWFFRPEYVRLSSSTSVPEVESMTPFEWQSSQYVIFKSLQPDYAALHQPAVPAFHTLINTHVPCGLASAAGDFVSNENDEDAHDPILSATAVLEEARQNLVRILLLMNSSKPCRSAEDEYRLAVFRYREMDRLLERAKIDVDPLKQGLHLLKNIPYGVSNFFLSTQHEHALLAVKSASGYCCNGRRTDIFNVAAGAAVVPASDAEEAFPLGECLAHGNNYRPVGETKYTCLLCQDSPKEFDLCPTCFLATRIDSTCVIDEEFHEHPVVIANSVTGTAIKECSQCRQLASTVSNCLAPHCDKSFCLLCVRTVLQRQQSRPQTVHGGLLSMNADIHTAFRFDLVPKHAATTDQRPAQYQRDVAGRFQSNRNGRIPFLPDLHPVSFSEPNVAAEESRKRKIAGPAQSAAVAATIVARVVSGCATAEVEIVNIDAAEFLTGSPNISTEEIRVVGVELSAVVAATTDARVVATGAIAVEDMYIDDIILYDDDDVDLGNEFPPLSLTESPIQGHTPAIENVEEWNSFECWS